MEFPQAVYVNLDEDSHDVNAYINEFAAIADDGEWTDVGVYKLQEVRRLRKVTEQQKAATKP
jgi:hypothetical protein